METDRGSGRISSALLPALWRVRSSLLAMLVGLFVLPALLGCLLRHRLKTLAGI